MEHTGTVEGRVSTAEQMDRLVVAPTRVEDLYSLAGILRESLGALRLDGRAVAVPSMRTPLLLHPHINVTLRWTEAARKFAENRERALRYHNAVRTEVERIKTDGSGVARHVLRDLEDSQTLDGHQLVNVACMTIPNGPGLCVFDEQGAGKTVTLIFAADLLFKHHEADLVLVIAPKSMVPEWPRDVKRFKGDLYTTAIVAGNRRQKTEILRAGADFLVTNFETAVALEDELSGLLRARDGRAIIAIDESFYAKNLDAKRTQVIRRLREWCGRAYVLCGTPAPNSPHDLVQQFNIVDFGVTFDGVEIPEERSEATPVVQSAVANRGLFVRHLKRDVLPNLPSKRFERLLIPLQPQQRRLYEGALRSLIVDLRAVDEAAFRREIASFLARRMVLLQICSHPRMVSSDYSETPAKLLALDAILGDLIERRKEKVIVWSYFRQSIEEIMRRFEKYGAVRYDGSVETVEERREAVRRFQEDDDTRVFVANPAAAGAGLTLHRGRIAVYESMGNQAAHYLQSLDRIHRRGQEREVEYLVLLVDGSVEIEEYERLRLKEQTAQRLLGDNVEPFPTRERMLGELTDAALRLQIDLASP